MNAYAAANLVWDENQSNLTYQLNTFNQEEAYSLNMYIEGTGAAELVNKSVPFEGLGIQETISLADLSLPAGSYLVKMDLRNDQNELLFQTSKSINIENVLSSMALTLDMKIYAVGSNRVQLTLPEFDDYQLRVVNLEGRSLYEGKISGNSYQLDLPSRGVYVFLVGNEKVRYSKKVLIK
jgi:hypothetical protein